MNKLLEIWNKKGLPFGKANMKDYDAVIHALQEQLNDIYAAFTGDYATGEISQIEVGRDALKNPSDMKSVEGFEDEFAGSPTTLRAPRGLFST